MPTLERTSRAYLPSVSVTLGDLESELAGLELDSPRHTVPSPQFQSFSLQRAFLHFHNLQDPLFRVFLRNLFGITRSDDIAAEDRPTDYAISTILELIWGARTLAGQPAWSNPEVDIAGNGGVRIKWRRGQRSVTVACPPNAQFHRYLYYANELVHRAIPDFESATLAERLTWLTLPHAPAM
jgi:hypothetical protein